MNWNEMAAALSEEQLRDLIGYLYDFERCQNKNRSQLEHLLLHGKKRNFFYLCDKSAYKTVKCLLRHPNRPLHLPHYPVEQLLELNVIEEIPSLTKEKDYGWYQIREEAHDFAQRIARTRHYDPLMAEMKRQDDIILGLFYSYGLLEMNQCCEMLRNYGVTIDPEHLFSSVTWRLSRRNVLQGVQIQRRGQTASFIILNDLDFMNTYRGITAHPDLTYELCSQDELLKRTSRYYAIELPAMKELKNYLLKSFSRKFAQTILQELIDAYQYHACAFTFEATIFRVFPETESRPYLEQAITALPDIYFKAHSADEVFGS